MHLSPVNWAGSQILNSETEKLQRLVMEGCMEEGEPRVMGRKGEDILTGRAV